MTVHERVREEVERHADELWRIGLLLHDKPELAFEEHLASAELVAALKAAQFEVEHGVASLPTAFRAHWGTGAPPRVALLLEYDALPGLGHACGHNLIATAGLGAALAVRYAMPDLAGTLMVVGTPAEEGGGGKVLELKAGVFDGIEAALMFHPGVHDWRYAPLTAQIEVGVRFHGRAAHPTGNPTEGVDALAALVQLFGALAMLRARLPLGSHVQGIVTEGGMATNIVPDLAEGRFGVRGLTTAARDDLVAQLTDAPTASPGPPARPPRSGRPATDTSTSATTPPCPRCSPGTSPSPASRWPSRRRGFSLAPRTSATSATRCRRSTRSWPSRTPTSPTTPRSSPRRPRVHGGAR